MLTEFSLHLGFTSAICNLPFPGLPGRKGRLVPQQQRISSQSIRVGVADATRMNSQLVVGALKRCHSNFEVQALTSNSSDAFSELQKYRPDVAVISAQLEDGPLTGFKV